MSRNSRRLDISGFLWLAALALLLASGICRGQSAAFEWRSFQLPDGQQFTGVDPVGVAIAFANAANAEFCGNSTVCYGNPQMTCPDTAAPTSVGLADACSYYNFYIPGPTYADCGSYGTCGYVGQPSQPGNDTLISIGAQYFVQGPVTPSPHIADQGGPVRRVLQLLRARTGRIRSTPPQEMNPSRKRTSTYRAVRSR